MKMKKRRRHSGSAPTDNSGGPTPSMPQVIFNNNPLGPRYVTRPGEGPNVSGGRLSRKTMVFIYAVIIGVIALCALGVILSLLHV